MADQYYVRISLKAGMTDAEHVDVVSEHGGPSDDYLYLGPIESQEEAQGVAADVAAELGPADPANGTDPYLDWEADVYRIANGKYRHLLVDQ